ncbi:MAG: hypothetical protein MUC62_09115, partial [Candidatus Thermoplasmatota archaeon]|nr:hypothetical protein [Candidatus Thermoplasmatota archaeon]
MGRWKERKGVALRAALLLIALLQLIPAALAEGPLLPPADLLLELRELTAGDFAYSVSYLVTNIGGSISRPCSLSVWDEHDMLTGNGTLVLERSLQELQPGRSLTVDLEWHLTTPSVHRLWAFADPENDVVEITKTNNIVFSTVSLPPPSELGLTIDGIPDDNRSGAYLAGVPLELGLVASTERGIDLAMYRFELYMDNGTSPLRSWSGGQGAPSLDVGKFPPGTHRMTLDSSFAGVRLGTSALDMIVVPIPVWTGSLSDLEMSFDRELEAYALSGTMDVPKLELLPEGENLSASSPIEVFEQEREVRIKAWVLPDMTTTFEIGLLAGMPHALDGSPLKAGRTVFRDGCELPDEVLLSATSDVVIDLSEHLRPITLPTGKGPDLPLDPAFITASGSFQVDLRVFRSTSGLAALSARADLEIQGNYEGTVFPDTLSGPGGASAVSADMVWKARSELLPGDDWTLTSGPVLERKNVSSDLTSPVWEPMRTYATMSGSHRGPFTSVHITSWNGNQTALGMWQEGSSVLLRGGYGRMAEPCIAPLY